MLKDVMVRLDEIQADEPRIAGAADSAFSFDGNLIGLFLNRLPDIIPPDGISTTVVSDVLEKGAARVMRSKAR